MAHPGYVYASAWRVCERRMVYELTVPEQATPWDPFTLAKFRRGSDRERDLLADLTRIGRNADPPFRIVGQQERFRVKDRKDRYVLSGKVDAFLELDDPTWRAPLEVKSWAPSLVERIESFADVLENPWTRGGAYQVLAYLYGHSQPNGFLVLDRSGLPKLIPVTLDDYLEEMEEFLVRAERVVDHALAGTLPPYLEGDAAECKRCPFFGGTCNPPLEAQGTTVIDDPDLEAELERWHSLRPPGREYNDLDQRLKQRLRGIEHGIIGPFSITGVWSRYNRLELPALVRKQFTKVDPKGRFTLEIERL
jgi:hypothetical protein